MLGIHAKRGIVTTLERVFNNTGNTIGQLEVLWTGKTAGIIFTNYGTSVDAKIIFPAIDETKDLSSSKFNNMIGYALHELGHAWFTENKPWDNARTDHGQFVSNLINGLEDPRIERKVIESGYAPNSRALFGELINSILRKDGYVDPAEKCQIPFILAVEGRRLNGYDICVPNIIDESPYAKHLHWALQRAQKATDTKTIVRIALDLFKRLKEQDDGDQPSDQPSDKQGGQQGDDKPSDKPSSKGKGKGSYDDKGRDVEPTSFIQDELKSQSCMVDDSSPRPIVLKPKHQTFEWV